MKKVDDYSKLTVRELTPLLKKRGLSIKGKKAVLLERLLEDEEGRKHVGNNEENNETNDNQEENEKIIAEEIIEKKENEDEDESEQQNTSLSHQESLKNSNPSDKTTNIETKENKKLENENNGNANMVKLSPSKTATKDTFQKDVSPTKSSCATNELPSGKSTSPAKVDVKTSIASSEPQPNCSNLTTASSPRNSSKNSESTLTDKSHLEENSSSEDQTMNTSAKESPGKTLTKSSSPGKTPSKKKNVSTFKRPCESEEGAVEKRMRTEKAENDQEIEKVDGSKKNTSFAKTVEKSNINPNLVKSMNKTSGMGDRNEIHEQMDSPTNTENRRVVVASKLEPTCTLRIDNFVRPFTNVAVRDLVQKHGKFVTDGFWMDKIKTHCFVTYHDKETAIETRNSLSNLVWPERGGRALIVEFSERSAMNVATGKNSSLRANTQNSNEKTTNRRAPPSVTIDDIFRKSKTLPHLYYLPLSEEEVQLKLQRKNHYGK